MGAAADPNEIRARLALLTLYRDMGIAVSDALSTGEIRALWPEQGVRAGDMRWAIDGLIRDGLLSRAPDEPDRLVLTAMGEQWLRAQPAWLEYRLLVLRAARARGRRRAGSDPQPVFLRRSGDPPTLLGGQ